MIYFDKSGDCRREGVRCYLHCMLAYVKSEPLSPLRRRSLTMIGYFPLFVGSKGAPLFITVVMLMIALSKDNSKYTKPNNVDLKNEGSDYCRTHTKNRTRKAKKLGVRSEKIWRNGSFRNLILVYLGMHVSFSKGLRRMSFTLPKVS